MGFLDRLLGRDTGSEATTREHASPAAQAAPDELTEEQALERYRYLVRTAPPDAIEQAHEEAFAKLTPEQRRSALRDLSAAVPEHERAEGDDPRALARMATRAELNRPGTVERALGGGGGMLGGTLLGSFAAAFAGTLVAQSLFSELGGEDSGGEADAGAEGDADADAGGADSGGGDFGGGDFGGGDISF